MYYIQSFYNKTEALINYFLTFSQSVQIVKMPRKC